MTPEILHYLSSRTVVNIDSFYRVRSLQIKDYQQAVEILSAKGYKKVPHTKNFALPTSVRTQPTEYTNIKSSGLIISSYLLGSAVNKQFLANILSYAESIGYQFLCVPHRYHNPTNLEEAIASSKSEVVDPLIVPYLTWKRFTIGRTVVFGDIKVNPTAVCPLNGFEALSGDFNGIFAHTKQTMRIIPGHVNMPPVIHMTTGGVSNPSMSDSAAGKKAEYHQRLGFIILDSEGHPRNVHASKDGSFQDYDKYVIDQSITTRPCAAAVWGDVHFGEEDKEAIDWAINTSNNAGCQKIFLHDVFDGSTINPHDLSIRSRHRLFRSLSAELEYVNYCINRVAQRTGSEMLIVDSNHNHFIDRHLIKQSAQTIDYDDYGVFLKYLNGEKLINGQHIDYTYSLHGIVLGYHGHKGSGGSRGSIGQFSKLASRYITGHSHSPAILNGSDVVGHLSIRSPEYIAGGLNAWAQSIVLVSEDAKVQHFIYKWW
jgi:hypothetical protein